VLERLDALGAVDAAPVDRISQSASERSVFGPTPSMPSSSSKSRGARPDAVLRHEVHEHAAAVVLGDVDRDLAGQLRHPLEQPRRRLAGVWSGRVAMPVRAALMDRGYRHVGRVLA
jgi:hypothetical protein